MRPSFHYGLKDQDFYKGLADWSSRKRCRNGLKGMRQHLSQEKFGLVYSKQRGESVAG